MTWYADEILIPASAKAVAMVQRDVLLKPHSYWVKSLDGFPWHSAEVVHKLTHDGLIVVRPVGQAANGHERWYGTRILDWLSLAATGPHAAEMLDRSADERLDDYLDGEAIPPTAFRAYLGQLALSLQVPLLYYSGSMWGGDIDSEYCLVYSPSERLVVTPSSLSDRGQGQDDSLQQGLRSIGVDIPTGFFALHTRSFPWDDHRLA